MGSSSLFAFLCLFASRFPPRRRYLLLSHSLSAPFSGHRRSRCCSLERSGPDTGFRHLRKTRTCIHTPGSPPMIPAELTHSNLISSVDGVRLVYFDVRLHETALLVAEEAARRNIPILIDAEKKREGLDELLSFASYVVCSAKFPQVH